MRSKLGLDKDVIARARHFARNIAADTQSYIDLTPPSPLSAPF